MSKGEPMKVYYPSDDAAPSLFLGGGISNCPDWQKDLLELLKEESVVVFNPRRAEYVREDGIARSQIRWEHAQLHRADAISFWFPKESVCPITLFELGHWIAKDTPLFVGVHPDYPRKLDIEEQLRLERPDIEIRYTLANLAYHIRQWAKSVKHVY